MANPLRVLILEDRQEDYELALRQLRRAGYGPLAKRVDNERDFVAALDSPFDIIISDYSLPGFDGLRALKLVQERRLDLPFILLSGTIGEEAAVVAMKQGVSDYVMKDRAGRLGQAVAHTLAEKQLRDDKRRADQQLKQTANRLANILNHASEAIIALNSHYKIIVFNKAAERMFGYDAAEVLGKPLDPLLPKGVAEIHPRHIRAFAESNESSRSMQSRQPITGRRKDGHEFLVEIGLSKLEEDGDQVFVAMLVDITERKRAEEAIQLADRRYRQLFEGVSVMNIVTRYHPDGPIIIDCNELFASTLGYSRSEVLGRPPSDFYTEASRAKMEDGSYQRALEGHQLTEERELLTKAGGVINTLVTAVPDTDENGKPIGTQVTYVEITERKKSEQALKLFRTLIDHSNDAVQVVDPETFRFLDINETACLALGYSRDELLSMSVGDIDINLGTPSSESINAEWRSTGHAIAESVHRRKDGSTFPVELNITSVQLDRRYVVTVVRDITERKRAEAAIRLTDRRYRQLFEGASVMNAVTRKHPSGAIVIDCNELFASVLGYARSEVLGRPLTDFYSESSRIKMNEGGYQRALDSKFAIEERDLLTKDGRMINVLVTSVPDTDENGQTIGTQATFVDITERKRAEEAVRESEARFRKVFEEGPIGMVLTSHDLRFFSANPAFCHMLGYTAEEMSSRTFLDVTHPDHRVTDRENVEKMWQGKIDHYRTEKRYIAKNGDIHWGSLSASLIRAQGDKPLYALAMVEDITERKQSEQALFASEHRYRSLFENMLEGFAYCRMIYEGEQPTDFEYLAINGAFEKLTGLKDVVGKRVTEVIPGIRESNPELLEIYGRVASTGKPEKFETWVEPLKIWFSISVYSMEKGFFVAVFDNISERKKAEQEILRRNQELIALHQIGQDLSHLAEPAEILESIFNGIGRVLDNRNLYIALYDEDKQYLTFPTYTMQGERRSAFSRAFGNGLTEYIIRSRAPLFVPRGLDDKMEELGIALIGTRAKTFMAAPMQVGEKIVGVIAVQDYERENAYAERDVELLSTFAAQAAIALENARLFEEARHRAEQFRGLYETVRELGTFNELPRLLQTIIDRATELLSAPSGIMYLFDPKREDLELVGVKASELKLGARYSIHEPNGMVAQAARTRQPVIVNDYQTWENRRPRTAELGIRAAIQVPMLYHGALIGILGVGEFGESTRKFSEEDVRLLSLFAGHAAAAVHNTRLLEETKQSANEFAALYDTALDLSAQTETARLLQTVVERAKALLGVPAGAVYLYDAVHNELELAISVGASLPIGARLKMGEGVAGRVAQSRAPLVVDDYHTWVHRSPLYEGVPFSAILHVPMLYGGALIGVLAVHEMGQSARKFAEADARLLTLLASQAASAVHNARLVEETRTRADEFTTLYEITRDLTTQYDLQLLLRTITERAARLLHASDGEMQLYDEKRSDLELIVNLNNHVPPGTRTQLGEGMAGRVAETKTPMVVDDYQTWEHRVPHYADLSVRGVVDIPMVDAGKLIGVLSVYECGKSTRRFNEQDTQLLSLFASQAASAVHNARLLEETKRRAEQLGTLNEIGRTISRHVEIENVIETLHKQAVRVFPFDAFYVTLYDSASGRLTYPLYYEGGKRYKESSTIMKRGTFLSRTIESASPLIINRTPEELGSPAMPANALGDTARKSASLMFAPMVYGSHVIGVISAQSYGLNAYNDGHLEMLGAIANQAAIAIENARLFEQAQRRAEEFSTLYETSRNLAAQTDLNGLLATIVERATRLLGAASGFIYLYNSLRDELELAVIQGFDSPRSPTLKMGRGIAGRVAQSKQPMIVKDYQTWEHRSPKYAEAGFRGILEVPMTFGGEIIGVLGVNEIGESTRQFTEEDARLLSLFAAHAASAVHNARLLQETRQRADEFAALYEINRDTATLQDTTALMQTIVDRAVGLLGASGGTMGIYDPSQKQIEVRVVRGLDVSIGTLLKLGEGVVGRVAVTREPMIVEDYRTWEHRLPRFEQTKPIVGIVAVPLLYSGELIGVVSVHQNDTAVKKFTEADARLLSLFAGQAASAVHNARLIEETKRRAEQLSTLNEIARAVSSQLEIDQALEAIYQQVKRILPLDAFYIALHDEERNEVSYPLLYDEGKRFSEPASTLIEGTRLLETLRSGKSILFNHTTESYKVNPKLWMLGDKSKASASFLYSPLRLGARVIGVISAQSYTFNAYSEEHLTLFDGVANQAAIAIENARLFADTQRHLQRVESLHEIDNAISGSLDLRVTFNVFLDQIVAQLGVDAADILLLNPHTQSLEFAAARGFRTPALQHTHLRVGDGLAGRAALERKIVGITDLAGELNGLARSPFILSEGFVSYHGVPLIAKGRVNGVLEIFHRTRIDRNKDWLDFLDTMAGQAAIAIDNAELYGNLQRANIDLSLAYDTTLEGWSRALDLRDRETEGHTQRVTEITLQLARELGINGAELVHIHRGALLHDIGKMGIPDAILFKPGPLTDDEWKIMRQHPVFAYELIAPIEFLRSALDIPYCHHEKWDGTGYPRGLKEEQIPLSARLFAVVDVWDALRSDRPYRRAWDEDKAREHIREQSGTHFDPKVVEVFLREIK